MSQENVERLKRAFAAFPADGVEVLLQFCSPELVVYPFPEWMEAPHYHGHDGLASSWRGGRRASRASCPSSTSSGRRAQTRSSGSRGTPAESGGRGFRSTSP